MQSPEKKAKIRARLKAYFKTVSVQARQLMLNALENQGDAPSMADTLILEVLREIVRDGQDLDPRRENFKREFFSPIDPFVTDVQYTQKYTGQIQRTSIETIWTWINQEFFSDESKKLIDQVNQDALNKKVDPKDVAESFRNEVTPQLRNAINETGGDELLVQKLQGRVGGIKYFQDMLDIVDIFEREAQFALFAEMIPEESDPSEFKIGTEFYELTRAYLKDYREDTLRIGVLLNGRIENKSLIIDFVLALARTAHLAKTVGSEFQGITEALLVELEALTCQIDKNVKSMRSTDEFLSLLKKFHVLSRELNAKFDWSEHRPWETRNRNISVRLGKIVENEAKNTAGAIRRAMRETRDLTISEGSRDEAERCIRIFKAASLTVDCLPLNEMMMKCRKDVEQSLNILSERVIDDFRKSEPKHRTYQRERSEMAIELCEIYFGESFAETLRKSLSLAIQRHEEASEDDAA